MKKALQLFCEQSGIFPAKCEDWRKWEEFAETSPRRAVERLYHFWALCSNLEEEASQKLERILRYRLLRLERPCLKTGFINAHKDEIFWVRSNWNARDIFSYMDWEKCSVQYPFYVVDEHNQVCGIAISKGFVLAGALNFAVTVDEAERFFARGKFHPLTKTDAELLEKNGAKVRRMMSAVGMPEINGGYLLVDSQTNGWRGQWFTKKITFKPKNICKGYFLLAKLVF